MNIDKYVGMDVDRSTCVIVIEDKEGNFVRESWVPTKAT